jgi:hypothetical protein
MKINVDAALGNNSRKCILAAVARIDAGAFLIASARTCSAEDNEDASMSRSGGAY